MSNETEFTMYTRSLTAKGSLNRWHILCCVVMMCCAAAGIATLTSIEHVHKYPRAIMVQPRVWLYSVGQPVPADEQLPARSGEVKNALQQGVQALQQGLAALQLAAIRAGTKESAGMTLNKSTPQPVGAVQTMKGLVNMVAATESKAKLVYSMTSFLNAATTFPTTSAAMDSVQEQLAGAVIDLVSLMAGLADVTDSWNSRTLAAKLFMVKVKDRVFALLTQMPLLGFAPIDSDQTVVAGKLNPTAPAGTERPSVACFTPADSSFSRESDTTSLERGTTTALDTTSDTTSNADSYQIFARHLLYQGGQFNKAWQREYGSFKSRWHPTVLKSVFKAQQLLNSTFEERAQRMFVPMLSNRPSELCCMLTDLDSKVGATNVLDVFVFTQDNNAQQVYNQSPCRFRQFNITVVFLPLAEHWGVAPRRSSSAVHDTSGWVPPQVRGNYRRMGHWRLTFQFAFADMLGYKYVWQLDDDSWFTKPVNFSMIAYMQQHDLWVAGARTVIDPHFVSWGLPEIARLFLVSERIAPAGSLFSNHTQPQGLDGLYTVRASPLHKEQPLKGDEGGWSRVVMYGNNIIIDMDKFWWPSEVQKFVELVVLTGYHFRFRWNEQGVMGMVWQIFVPMGHFQFNTLPIAYHHPRKEWGSCGEGQVQVS